MWHYRLHQEREQLPAKALHCYINGKRNQGRQPKKCKRRYGSKEVEGTTSNGSALGQKQMETSSSSLIIIVKQESPANAKGTRDSSSCMKAHCEQM